MRASEHWDFHVIVAFPGFLAFSMDFSLWEIAPQKTKGFLSSFPAKSGRFRDPPSVPQKSTLYMMIIFPKPAMVCNFQPQKSTMNLRHDFYWTKGSDRQRFRSSSIDSPKNRRFQNWWFPYLSMVFPWFFHGFHPLCLDGFHSCLAMAGWALYPYLGWAAALGRMGWTSGFMVEISIGTSPSKSGSPWDASNY